MKKTIVGIFATGFMLLAFSAFAVAQKKNEITLHSRPVDASRGSSNPKIKSEAPAIDKVETKPRGGCTIYFDNYSGLYVKVYIDGKYFSTISPYGDCTVVVADQYTEIYLISTGGTRDWEFSCGCTGRRYTYSLY